MINKTYNPVEIEQKWYEFWEKEQYFSPRSSSEAFCIMIPPPNVTGSLHMGHAFEASLMDALTRYHRMTGKQTLWQVGTDHAGIATQMVVERKLHEEEKTRYDLGREAFIKQIWRWKAQSGGTIAQQLRRMGASVDWQRERFTMDETMSNAVQEVFVRLYDEGLIYRGTRLVNWDPVFQTAISDLEVENTQEKGHLWHIRYPLVDSSDFLVVATTRPETLFGDVAVAVNPDDSRFRHLIGQSVYLPLTDRIIPIIADEAVDRAFGTGCLKITPAHDFNDYQVGLRHSLEPINILTPDAKLNDAVPKNYQGLDRFSARKKVIDELSAAGLIDKIVDHELMIPRGDRSQAIIEPYLTQQWYVRIQPLAGPAIEAVEKGRIKFFPETWTNTYYAWMRNIEDWCISRQLWWGHRIPAWYDKEGHIYVGRSEDEVRQKYQLDVTHPLVQDEDVLDTWFSSALWPFATLGWPEKTEAFKTFYPTTTLITGYDIIFFWVARMIMMGLKFTGDIPFKDVYIHGLIRDSQGQKMSKSKGNVLDPLDLIDGIDLEHLVLKRTHSLMQPQKAKQIEAATRKEFAEGIPSFGTDALRFSFCSMASTSRNIQFDLNRVGGYRNFCNKLWNAARYVFMKATDADPALGDEPITYTLSDCWIRSRLQKTIIQVHQSFLHYRFDHVAQQLYDFVWHEYCDWYLELSKPILGNSDSKPSELRGTLKTLVDVLDAILRLLHPLIPFITEEIWQNLIPFIQTQHDSLMLATYPHVKTEMIDEHAETEIEWIKSIILAIRNIRGEMNISPSKALPLILRGGSKQDLDRFDRYNPIIIKLAKIESYHWLDESEQSPPSASAILNTLELLVPMTGLIDVKTERARLEKELNKLTKLLDASEQKLNNPNFVDKAPEALVTKERQLAKEYSEKISHAQLKLEELTNLSKAL